MIFYKSNLRKQQVLGKHSREKNVRIYITHSKKTAAYNHNLPLE